jgi:hypothetical protein
MLDMKRSGDKDFTHGEFVMAWADFISVYDHVCLAIVNPRGWTEAAVTGRWPAAPRHLWHFRKHTHRDLTALSVSFAEAPAGSQGEQYALEVCCVHVLVLRCAGDVRCLQVLRDAEVVIQLIASDVDTEGAIVTLIFPVRWWHLCCLLFKQKELNVSSTSPF